MGDTMNKIILFGLVFLSLLMNVSALSINNTIPSEINSYELNLTQYVSCSDSGFCFVDFYEVNISHLTDFITYHSLDTNDISGATSIDNYGQGYNFTCTNMGGDCNTGIGIKVNSSHLDDTALNYINTNNDSLCEITTATDRTFSIWAKSDVTTGDIIIACGYDGGAGQYAGWKFQTLTGGDIIFQGLSGSTAYDIQFAGNTFTEWNHYVVVFDSGTAYLYENGILGGSVSIVNFPYDNYFYYGVQSDDGVFGGYYDGMFDEIGIYDRALNTSEIKVLYESIKKEDKIFSTNGNKSYNINAVNLTTIINESGNILVNPYQYFYAYDLSSSSNINNFSLVLNNNTQYSTTTGLISILWNVFNNNQNNTLQFNTTGYSPIEYTYLITNTSNLNETLNTTASGVYITFRDIESNNLINSVEIELSGTSFSNNYSTSSGSLNITDFNTLPDTYNIVASSTGYETNYRDFTFNGIDDVTMTIYMINTSSATDLLIEVRDSSLNTLPNIDITIKKYDVSTNSYLPIIQKTTNDVGQIKVEIDYSFKYQFVLDDGTDSVTKQGQYVTTSPLYLEFAPTKERITLSNDFSVYSDISFINTTTNYSKGYFRYEFNDPTNTISEGCMKVYTSTYNVLTFVEETCSQVTSGTIFSSTLNISYGQIYLIRGFVTLDGSEEFVEEQPFLFNLPDISFEGSLGLMFSLLLFFVLVLGGTRFDTDPKLLIIFSLIPLFVGAFFGSLPIKIGSIITFGSIIAYILIFKRK